MTIWVLAADSGRARVFQTDSIRNKFIELTSLSNPQARLREVDLVTDTPGSLKDSSGSGYHSYTPKHLAKEIIEKSFAKDVASSLNEAFQRKDFQQLYIIAAPKFLGELREHLTDGIKEKIRGEFHHDVSKLKAERIQDFLKKRLSLPQK